MTHKEVLQNLGARDDTLTGEEKAQLDQDGFTILRQVFSAEEAALMLSEIERIFAEDNAGQPGGPPECGNLQNRSAAFDICFTNPRVLAAVAYVLREEFGSMGVHSRPNPPGRGHQALHEDWGGDPAVGGEYCVCNSIWPLVDFTTENGATRLVPGSHRFGKSPQAALANPDAPHPDEISLTIAAGDVCVFNSHVWHGATLNRSSADRPNVTSYWTRRTWPGRTIEVSELSATADARLSEAARRLFRDAPRETVSAAQVF